MSRTDDHRSLGGSAGHQVGEAERPIPRDKFDIGGRDSRAARIQPTPNVGRWSGRARPIGTQHRTPSLAQRGPRAPPPWPCHRWSGRCPRCRRIAPRGAASGVGARRSESGIRGRWIGSGRAKCARRVGRSGLRGSRLTVAKAIEDLERLFEPIDTLGRFRKFQAETVVLLGIPAGPDPQDQASAADVIDGGRLLRQQRRMTEGVAAHQHAETNARCQGRERRERRPCLEDGAVAGVGQSA